MSLGKITGATTLAELALRRGQFGVEHITITYDLGLAVPVRVVLHTGDLRTIGRGETEAQALDDAFARLMQRTGENLTVGDAPRMEPM